MTSLREAADLIAAKHVYFVMDSCYSGLALTRGAGAFSKDRSYLDEIQPPEARQILTAGGADQQVADDGPGGHSVFTWALLEGLQGKADLDGNGVITASELGAYVSPIVASFAEADAGGRQSDRQRRRRVPLRTTAAGRSLLRARSWIQQGRAIDRTAFVA